jgi:mRNA-degrading endonuclease toxin of MazEF toxin-antitoxin module
LTFSQGSIVLLDFDPAKGHEQSGYRPALVLSRTLFNQKTGMLVVCPITTKLKPFPLRVALDSRTETRGYIICDQIRTLDPTARKLKYAEALPPDLLESALYNVSAIFDMD